MKKQVCVIGLGYVGLTLSISLANKGCRVFGIEIDQGIIKALDNDTAHFHEPGINDKIRILKQQNQFSYGTGIDQCENAGVYIITVGTPLDASGLVNLSMIEAVAGDVSKRLKDGDLVIVRSTVKCGVTSSVVKPILDRSSVDYDLAFCPERTIEGKALSELEKLPQIIGGIDKDSTIAAANFFSVLTEKIITLSSAEAAEIAKLVSNAQRDVQFAYANEVALVCDQLGLNAFEIIESVNIDYPRASVALPGLVGGPCLEKDSYIFSESIQGKGGELRITLTARSVNETIPTVGVQAILKAMSVSRSASEQIKIVLFGLSFKGRPETNDLRGTLARPFLTEIKTKIPHAQYFGFDPMLSQSEISSFGLNPVSSIEASFENADLVVFLNNNEIFSQINLNALAVKMADGAVIYDFWNLFPEIGNSNNFPRQYICFGRGSISKVKV